MKNPKALNISIDEAQYQRTQGKSIVTKKDKVYFIGGKDAAEDFAFVTNKGKGFKVFHQLIKHTITKAEAQEALNSPNLYSWSLSNNSQL